MKSMFERKRRSLSLVCFLLLSFLVFHESAFGASVPEIRQLVADSQKRISTARVEYTARRYKKARHIPELAAAGAYIPQVRAVNQHTVNRIVAVTDLDNRRERILRTDLRDLDELLSDNELPQSQWAELDRSVEYISQGHVQLNYRRPGPHSEEPQLYVGRAPGNIANQSGLLAIGVIQPRQLSGEWNLVSSEPDSGELPLVTLEFSKETNGVRDQVTYTCDPALGYRYTRKRIIHAGQLRVEVVAGDYRDIKGRPFPFQCSIRRFDPQGELLEESEYTFAKVELDVEVSDGYFKFQVPPGARLIDFRFGEVIRLSIEGSVGIEDVLRRYRSSKAEPVFEE